MPKKPRPIRRPTEEAALASIMRQEKLLLRLVEKMEQRSAGVPGDASASSDVAATATAQ